MNYETPSLLHSPAKQATTTGTNKGIREYEQLQRCLVRLVGTWRQGLIRRTGELACPEQPITIGG
jgi:hypothetical protein